MKNEVKTLSNSIYRCEYHKVFAPKYRRRVRYRENPQTTMRSKKVEIIETEACKDHIYLLVSILPYMSIAQFVGYLKGKVR